MPQVISRPGFSSKSGVALIVDPDRKVGNSLSTCASSHLSLLVSLFTLGGLVVVVLGVVVMVAFVNGVVVLDAFIGGVDVLVVVYVVCIEVLVVVVIVVVVVVVVVVFVVDEDVVQSM